MASPVIMEASESSMQYGGLLYLGSAVTCMTAVVVVVLTTSRSRIVWMDCHVAMPAFFAINFAASLPSVTRRLKPVAASTACRHRPRG
jgi:hypothetical protein